MCGYSQQSHQCQQFDIHGGGRTGCRRAAVFLCYNPGHNSDRKLRAELSLQLGERESEEGVPLSQEGGRGVPA